MHAFTDLSGMSKYVCLTSPIPFEMKQFFRAYKFGLFIMNKILWHEANIVLIGRKMMSCQNKNSFFKNNSTGYNEPYVFLRTEICHLKIHQIR